MMGRVMENRNPDMPGLLGAYRLAGKIMPSRASCPDERQGYPIILIPNTSAPFPLTMVASAALSPPTVTAPMPSMVWRACWRRRWKTRSSSTWRRRYT